MFFLKLVLFAKLLNGIENLHLQLGMSYIPKSSMSCMRTVFRYVDIYDR